MAVNWFEGGRRITALLASVVLLAGAIYVFFGGDENRVVLETNAPDERFKWTLSECYYPDRAEPWRGKVQIGSGGPRTVVACFRQNRFGTLWYAIGSEESVQLARSNGRQPPPIRVRPYLATDVYSDAADAYIRERMASYRATGEELDEISDRLWQIAWVRFWGRVKEAAPWMIGIIFGLWVLTAASGWIVRGFVGIPSGRDFKSISDENSVSTSSNSSVAVLQGLLASSAIAWGLAAAMIAIIPALTSAVPRIGTGLSKLLQAAGAFVFIGIAFAGGFGLWLLTHLVLKRKREMKTSFHVLAIVSFLNVMLVWAVSWPLLSYTSAGQWYVEIDRWSRASGYADFGTIAVASVFWLWPYIPLLIVRGLRAKAVQETRTNTLTISTHQPGSEAAGAPPKSLVPPVDPDWP